MVVQALNGQDIGLGYKLGDVTPQFMQWVAQESLDAPDPERPSWRDDPTYNLRRQK